MSSGKLGLSKMKPPPSRSLEWRMNMDQLRVSFEKVRDDIRLFTHALATPSVDEIYIWGCLWLNFCICCATYELYLTI